MATQTSTAEPTPASPDIEHGFALFLGALGQRLSDETSLRHAAWWSGAATDELADLVRCIYPAGLTDERRAQATYLNANKRLRTEATAFCDNYLRRYGTASQVALSLCNELLNFFPDEDATFLMKIASEREFYQRKKQMWHVFRAGRADPIRGFPERPQQPIPAGITMWRGL